MSVQNEKLIEEAKHLIEQAGSFREQVGDDASPTSMIGLWLRTADALHAALAEFEKAHTPTDDEREAHRRVIELWFANWRDIGKVSPALELAIDSLEGMVDEALDVGFRRSSVSSSAEEREEIARIIDGHVIMPVSSRLAIARSLQGNGFRHAEVPEPSTDWHDLAVKAFPWDASEGDAVLDARRRMGQVLTDNFPEPCAECPQCHRPDGLHKLGCGERFGSEPQGEPSSAQEAIRVASPDTWDWDACVVCGSKDVTDRGMMVLFSAKDGVYISRVAWCDQSQECRDDLRQAGASMLTDQDAKSIDAALRAAAGVVTQEGDSRG